MLQIVDAQWKDHLYSLDHLKEGIGLRGYGQRDPLVEYKKESFALFQAMKDRVEEEMVRYLWRLTPVVGEEARRRRRSRPAPPRPAPPPQMTLNSAASRRPPPSPFGAIRRRRRQRRRAGGRQPPRPARTAATTSIKTGQARRAEGRPQRSVPVRQRQEVQEVPRARHASRVAASQCRSREPISIGPIKADVRGLFSGDAMETRTDVLNSDQIAIGLATALTFDDVLLVPRHSQVLPSAGRRLARV